MSAGSSKIWRESATLILAARTAFTTGDKFNYKVLCMKRSAKSGFMPSTYVFPGGALSKSDTNTEWLRLYENFGFSKNFPEELRAKSGVPSILQDDAGTPLKELAFRICAIRETFEECGILLCKTAKVSDKSNWASFIGGFEIAKWQSRVHQDPDKFLKLCSQLEIYPDVWGLKIWSNWLTPPSLKSKFNAVFFLACLNQRPAGRSDGKEVDEIMWTTPDRYIGQNTKQTIMLPVPQFYEISRLKNMHDINTLLDFAGERSSFGCETYWPHRIATDGGLYSILPGDDLYPGRIDASKTDILRMATLPDATVLHRMFHESEYKSKIITQNFTPKCNHLAPKADSNPP